MDGMFWKLFLGALALPGGALDTLGEVLSQMIGVCCMPFTFDWASSLMTTFQGVAIGIVVLIVILRGILTGILLEGGSEDESVGHYLFTSIVPVAIIAAAPTLTSIVSDMVAGLISTITGHVGSGIVDSFLQGYEPLITASEGVGGLMALILLIVNIYYIIVICMQCLRRWVQLTVLSVIMPLVAVMTAMDDSSDLITLIKSMFFNGVITVLQLAALCSVGALSSWAGANGLQGVSAVFVMVAAFGAIKHIPDWIEKYTYAASAAGRSGNASRMIVPMGRFAGGIGRGNGKPPAAATRSAAAVMAAGK